MVLEGIDRLELAGQAPQFDEENPSIVPYKNAQNFMKFLFSDQPISSAFINWSLVSGLLIQKNATLLKEIRAEIQGYLMKLAQQLNDPKFAACHEQKLAEMLIGNILALYPFFEPENGELLNLPQKIDGKWQLVEYKVNLLQMTPSWKGDPYYACGLVPTNNPSAICHLYHSRKINSYLKTSA